MNLEWQQYLKGSKIIRRFFTYVAKGGVSVCFRHYEKKGEKETASEFDLKEYHLQTTFKTTEQALNLFKDDELMSKPGECFAGFFYFFFPKLILTCLIISIIMQYFVLLQVLSSCTRRTGSPCWPPW